MRYFRWFNYAKIVYNTMFYLTIMYSCILDNAYDKSRSFLLFTAIRLRSSSYSRQNRMFGLAMIYNSELELNIDHNETLLEEEIMESNSNYKNSRRNLKKI